MAFPIERHDDAAHVDPGAFDDADDLRQGVGMFAGVDVQGGADDLLGLAGGAQDFFLQRLQRPAADVLLAAFRPVRLLVDALPK